jgi:hypothetical protein
VRARRRRHLLRGDGVFAGAGAGSLADRPDIGYQGNRQRHNADEDGRRHPTTRQQERPVRAEALVAFLVR